MNLPQPRYKVIAHHTEDKHFYGYEGSQDRFPGYSEIGSLLSKANLGAWQVGVALDHFIDVLKQSEVVPSDLELAALKIEAKKAPNRLRDKAGSKGTDVHELIETYLKTHKTPDLTGLTTEIVQSYSQFIKWLESSKWECIASELLVLSQDLGVGGTVDGLFLDEKGKIVITDFKTSKSIWPSMFFQLGCYMEGLVETYDIMPLRAGILHISTSNCHWIEYPNPFDLPRAFKALKTTYNFHEQFKNFLGGCR